MSDNRNEANGMQDFDDCEMRLSWSLTGQHDAPVIRDAGSFGVYLTKAEARELLDRCPDDNLFAIIDHGSEIPR